MLKQVLKRGFTKRSEVTRQLVNVQWRVGLIIAPFHASVCSQSVNISTNISEINTQN